jgi:hypothetical protein
MTAKDREVAFFTITEIKKHINLIEGYSNFGKQRRMKEIAYVFNVHSILGFALLECHILEDTGNFWMIQEIDSPVHTKYHLAPHVEII